MVANKSTYLNPLGFRGSYLQIHKLWVLPSHDVPTYSVTPLGFFFDINLILQVKEVKVSVKVILFYLFESCHWIILVSTEAIYWKGIITIFKEQNKIKETFQNEHFTDIHKKGSTLPWLTKQNWKQNWNRNYMILSFLSLFLLNKKRERRTTICK